MLSQGLPDQVLNLLKEPSDEVRYMMFKAIP